MDKRDLKNIEKIIADRSRKSCYIDNRIIGNGNSNVDDITLDFDAFFSLYDKKDEKNRTEDL